MKLIAYKLNINMTKKKNIIIADIQKQMESEINYMDFHPEGFKIIPKRAQVTEIMHILFKPELCFQLLFTCEGP